MTRPIPPTTSTTSTTVARSRRLRLLPPVYGGPFVSLKDRDYRLLWFGTVFVGFGQWGQQIGINWLIFVLTDSAVQLGAVAFAGGILSLLLTPFAGVLADRYSRRLIILLATIAGAIQATVPATLVVSDTVEVWQVAGGLSPLGALSMGYLIETVGIRTGVAVHIGVALVVMLLVTLFGRSLRRLD